MKKYLSLILALCLPALLGGCGAVPLPMPESPTPPPAADTEEITYEVSTDPYEQTVTAEDGTTLMVIDFQIAGLRQRCADRRSFHPCAGAGHGPGPYL